MRKYSHLAQLHRLAQVFECLCASIQVAQSIGGVQVSVQLQIGGAIIVEELR